MLEVIIIFSYWLLEGDINVFHTEDHMGLENSQGECHSVTLDFQGGKGSNPMSPLDQTVRYINKPRLIDVCPIHGQKFKLILTRSRLGWLLFDGYLSFFSHITVVTELWHLIDVRTLFPLSFSSLEQMDRI